MSDDFCDEARCMLPSWHIGPHQQMIEDDGMVQVTYWGHR